MQPNTRLIAPAETPTTDDKPLIKLIEQVRGNTEINDDDSYVLIDLKTNNIKSSPSQRQGGAIEGANAIPSDRDMRAKTREANRQKAQNLFDKMLVDLKQILLQKCIEKKPINLYVINTVGKPQEYNQIKTLVDDLNTNECRLQGGTRRGASLGIFQGGGTHVDFKLSKNQVGTLGNLAFFNVVKFARYRYLTKESDLDIDIKLFVDFLSTTIVCVFLQAFRKEKLALGSLVDQVVSMSLYWKSKNPNLLLLPYYVPFVYE